MYILYTYNYIIIYYIYIYIYILLKNITKIVRHSKFIYTIVCMDIINKIIMFHQIGNLRRSQRTTAGINKSYNPNYYHAYSITTSRSFQACPIITSSYPRYNEAVQPQMPVSVAVTEEIAEDSAVPIASADDEHVGTFQPAASPSADSISEEAVVEYQEAVSEKMVEDRAVSFASADDEHIGTLQSATPPPSDSGRRTKKM